jgi:hypothetical protein
MALADLIKDLRFNPADAGFVTDRARLLLATGEKGQARADRRKAVRQRVWAALYRRWQEEAD